MENFYLIQVIDLRFPVDNVTSKKVQRLEESGSKSHSAHRNASLFAILIKRREKMISDRDKITRIKNYKK